MQKKWQIEPEISTEIKDQFPEFNSLILQLLVNRGLKSQAEIDEFLLSDYSQDIHDPFLFREMEKAVERIFEAIAKEEKIIIHGDYDADGVCGSVILMETFGALGAKNFDVFLPHRQEEGYGLRLETVEKFAQTEVNLIITNDCGISNLAEAKLARQRGLDLIVTDHHYVPEKLPEAVAIVHPQVPGDNYPYKNLIGAGVAFKLASALTQEAEKRRIFPPQDFTNWSSFTKWLLDLVAVATIADMGELRGENRTLVKYGLVVLNKTRRLGFKKLFEQARLGPASKNGGEIKSENVAFGLAPRINAAGRMNHANVAFNLLMTRGETEAEALASELEKNNQDRKAATDEIITAVKAQLTDIKDEKILFAFHENWPLGLLGLVAGRIADEYYLPAIIMSRTDEGVVGSGRSIEEFNIIEALNKLQDFLFRYGGHPQACGFTLKKEINPAEFKSKFRELAQNDLKDKELRPALKIEAEVTMDDISWDFYSQLEQFAPFGEGNPVPRFLGRDLEVVEVSSVGKKGDHLRLMVRSRGGKVCKMIGFCLGSSPRTETNWCERLKAGNKIEAVFEVGVNEWNGQRELEYKIVDLRLLKQ